MIKEIPVLDDSFECRICGGRSYKKSIEYPLVQAETNKEQASLALF